MSYVVIENTPGTMPDSWDPFETEEYQEAVAHANVLADELEQQGYRCRRDLASSGNYYSIYCERPDTVAPDLGRHISVTQSEEE